MVALRHAIDADGYEHDVAELRADVARLLDGVPREAWGARPEDIRRIGRACLDAAAAAGRRREKVGDAPDIDDDATAHAFDAREALGAARVALYDAGTESARLLGVGNAWGIAVLGAALVLVKAASVEPMSPVVAATVMGAAAGPCTTALLALVRRASAATRVQSARAEWSAALEATGASTLGELHARRIARAAWQRREDEALAAEAAAEDALRQWHALAGEELTPAHAPWLARRLTEARAAQLRLLSALLDEARVTRSTPPPSMSVSVSLQAPMAPRDDTWLGDAISRLRGRGLRLWSR